MRLLKLSFLIFLINSCTLFSSGRYSDTVELSEGSLYYWPCNPGEIDEWKNKFCSWQCITVAEFDRNSCIKGKTYSIDMREGEAMGLLRAKDMILIKKEILGAFSSLTQ